MVEQMIRILVLTMFCGSSLLGEFVWALSPHSVMVQSEGSDFRVNYDEVIVSEFSQLEEELKNLPDKIQKTPEDYKVKIVEGHTPHGKDLLRQMLKRGKITLMAAPEGTPLKKLVDEVADPKMTTVFRLSDYYLDQTVKYKATPRDVHWELLKKDIAKHLVKKPGRRIVVEGPFALHDELWAYLVSETGVFILKLFVNYPKKIRKGKLRITDDPKSVDKWNLIRKNELNDVYPQLPHAHFVVNLAPAQEFYPYSNTKLMNLSDESFHSKDRFANAFLAIPDNGTVDIVTAGGGGDVYGAILQAMSLKEVLLKAGKKNVRFRVFTSNLKRGSENPKGGPAEMKNILYPVKGKLKAIPPCKNSRHFYRIFDGIQVVSSVSDDERRDVVIDGKDLTTQVALCDGEIVEKAKSLGIEVLMADAAVSGKELAEDYEKMTAGESVFTIIGDMGGDIAARFPVPRNHKNYPEKDVRSPNTDTLFLDMAYYLKKLQFSRGIEDKTWVSIAAYGGDGELGYTGLQYLKEIIGSEELQAVFYNLKYLTAHKSILDRLLQWNIHSEVSGNLINNIRKWIEEYKPNEYEEKRSPWSFDQASQIKGPQQTIRNGTRTVVMPVEYVNTIYVAPETLRERIDDQINTEGKGWFDIDQELRSKCEYTTAGEPTGLCTEMTDPNNIRDRKNVNVSLLVDHVRKISGCMTFREAVQWLFRKGVLGGGANAYQFEKGLLFLKLSQVYPSEVLIQNELKGLSEIFVLMETLNKKEVNLKEKERVQALYHLLSLYILYKIGGFEETVKEDLKARPFIAEYYPVLYFLLANQEPLDILKTSSEQSLKSA